jgi:hypothetical protein
LIVDRQRIELIDEGDMGKTALPRGREFSGEKATA